MTINYSNTGHATAYDVDVYFEGQSGFIDILDPEQNFASIGFLGVFNKTFNVVVDENTPEGIVVDFKNELLMGNYYSDKTFKQKICPLMEDFETGDFTKYNWEFPEDIPWTTSMQYPYQGNFSATSGDIGTNQSTEIKITYQVMSSDSITFIRKVSSEDSDKLKFYIGNTLVADWSGTNEGWRKESFAVSPGYKSFRWVYSKDYQDDGGSDKGWLDNISLPSPVAFTIWAGPDAIICTGDEYQIVDAYGTDYATSEWTTSGSGTFNDNTQMLPRYTPSAEDLEAGTVTLTLTLTNSDEDVLSDNMALTFNGGPEAPPTAAGPEYVDLFEMATSDYTTEGLPDILDYNWYLDPLEAGTIEGVGMYATVTWNPEYLGMAYISVAGIGECGEGDLSASLAVTVDNTVGVSENGWGDMSMDIYPNPGEGIFNILFSGDDPSVKELKIINIVGETIITRSVNTSISHYLLNLEDIPDGIYFLVIGSDENTITRKLVKK
jgi:hypothetical protein